MDYFVDLLLYFGGFAVGWYMWEILHPGGRR